MVSSCVLVVVVHAATVKSIMLAAGVHGRVSGVWQFAEATAAATADTASE